MSADEAYADLPERLAAVRARIESAGGDPAAVRIVAVTKGHGPGAVRAAAAAGLRDVGENYAQDLLEKMPAPPGVGVHFLGAIQRNKVGRLAPHVTTWQTVDRHEVVEAIARAAPGATVYVQVNITGDPGRPGCDAADVASVVAAAAAAGLDVAGLMGVGPAGAPEAARPGFRALAALRSEHGLRELSLGMTGDLEVAVAEGATVVRVGTALFGPRPAPPGLRR